MAFTTIAFSSSEKDDSFWSRTASLQFGKKTSKKVALFYVFLLMLFEIDFTVLRESFTHTHTHLVHIIQHTLLIIQITYSTTMSNGAVQETWL